MEVVIKGCDKLKGHLEVYSERARGSMSVLSSRMGFDLPKEVLFTTIKNAKDKVNYAVAIYDPRRGCSVEFGERCLKFKPENSLWIVDHEMAHLAIMIKHKRVDHDDLFYRTLGIIIKHDMETG